MSYTNLKTSILIVLLLIITSISAQNIAKVSTINGVEAYISCNPLRTYQVVGYTDTPTVQWSSILTQGQVNESVEEKLTKYVSQLQKKYNSFDAVVYTSGKQMSCIKFTDVGTSETIGMAEVNKINGIPFYVFNEPVKDYTVVKTKYIEVHYKSRATAGLVNNTIKEDLVRLAQKSRRQVKKGKVDAIVYNGGTDFALIKFN
ncbi:MAG: hypothetical protein H6604_01430 [Flavobacteriales bacterium]|nr:hypothetical protein [Flavobacteriales bacterium]